ncbi:hypothetical protein AOQ84DRAFT_994 [Glonium stellatum]|uniref:Uncharacterized protein n=1 Tax=Glonium stellatum TaxID=574774 RepID=A0A8E2JV23_9PEZI|nr:hypothetical protein AOQ84DRAFT_994 [Glonium stellatum]
MDDVPGDSFVLLHPLVCVFSGVSVSGNLSVTSAPPDPLGISRVSGFYGPGAWAGWFLTLAASWIGLASHPRTKFDLNTWLFLLGVAWASADLIHLCYSLGTLTASGASSEVLDAERGSIGAAYTVVFWGYAHALLQLIICSQFEHLPIQRLRTITIGLLLPFISLMFMANFIPDYRVPALYWHGMSGCGHFTYNLILFYFIALKPVGNLLFLYSLMPHCTLRRQPGQTTTTISITYPPIPRRTVKIGMFTVKVPGIKVIGFPAYERGSPGVPVSVPIRGCFVCVWWSGSIFFLLSIPFISVCYIFKAYFRLGSSPSQSCFFMPCAPQSISDSDQAYALLGGLVTFLFEIVPALLRYIKRKLEERRNRVSPPE